MLKYIGANVYRLRRERRLTQEKLAEAAGIELTFFQKIERSETNFGVALLVKLADALDVTPGSLLEPAERPPTQRGRPRKKPADE